MRLSKEETETTITFVRADTNAKLYTCDPVVKRKFNRLCEQYPDEYQFLYGDDLGVFYTFPFKRLRFTHALKKKSVNPVE